MGQARHVGDEGGVHVMIVHMEEALVLAGRSHEALDLDGRNIAPFPHATIERSVMLLKTVVAFCCNRNQ